MAVSTEQVKSDLTNLIEAGRFAYLSDKRIFFAKLVFIALQSILPLVSLYLLKRLIDSVTGSSNQPDGMSSIGLYASLFCGVFVMNRIISIIHQLSDEVLSQKLIDYISGLLHKKSSELDLAYYDNSLYHDTFHRAQQEAGHRPMQMLSSLSGLTSSALSLLGVFALLAAFSWIIIVIMVVAGLPAFGVKLLKIKAIYVWRKSHTSWFRKANYFSQLLTNRIYAKELRVFQLATYFQDKFNSMRKNLVERILAISMKRARYDIFAVILEGIALLAIIFMLSRKTFTGDITIGSFVMFFEAFRKGQGYLLSIVNNVAGLYENKLFLNNLFEFFHLQPEITTMKNPVPFPHQIKHGIKFDNVSFAYPGSSKYSILHLNLLIKPGEICCIHGDNGSGKTTLIKLICRLYDCSEGAIYIDDVDIRRFDLMELRKNISVIFQDFVHYDLTARENITLGDLGQPDDSGEQLNRAASMSTAKQIIDNLPLHFDTPLGKYFENSEELSMGQWQRIALGRALFSNSPILLLDEPSGWMDLNAEFEFYRNLNSLQRNRIIILVNHNNMNLPCNTTRIDILDGRQQVR